MIDCIILGDSIGVGLKQYLPSCVSYSHNGWNTKQWNKEFTSIPLLAKTVIISLGSNDHKHIKTEEELIKVRSRIISEQVVWILPAIPSGDIIRESVYNVARQNKDIVLPINYKQKDNVHPSKKGYQDLLNNLKQR